MGGTIYTSNGMESVIDDFDSGTGTVTEAMLNLYHDQNGSNQKGLVVINGTMSHTSNTAQYFRYTIRNTTNLSSSYTSTGSTVRLESSGTTSTYGWSTAYDIYMNRYQITSNRQFPFTIYLDLRENGTSTPYQRMHFHSECVGYTYLPGIRSFWQTAQRTLDNTTVGGIVFKASVPIRISVTAYALAGQP